ncbi:MAG: hypothetical protein H6849_03360 [Alphaproteobacteria bacterium]|nr:MAG: hypothetical protein H6849_03360 [Alphaproteobacteria bacterium]
MRNSVGELFGGVDDARIKSAISQYTTIRGAVIQFVETFDALPGNFSEADQVFGQDSPVGRGDGHISGAGLDAPHKSEAAAFWLHLSQAKMLSLPDIIAPDRPLRPNIHMPDSSFQYAAFSVKERPFGWKGVWLVLGAVNGSDTDGGAFTPLQAKKFLKISGLRAPQSGNTRIANGRGLDTCLSHKDRLNFRSGERACTVYFRLWGG